MEKAWDMRPDRLLNHAVTYPQFIEVRPVFSRGFRKRAFGGLSCCTEHDTRGDERGRPMRCGMGAACSVLCSLRPGSTQPLTAAGRDPRSCLPSFPLWAHPHSQVLACCLSMKAASQSATGGLLPSVQLMPSLGDTLQHLPALLESIGLWREKVRKSCTTALYDMPIRQCSSPICCSASSVLLQTLWPCG